MAKKNITYEVSMEKIEEFVNRKGGFFHRPDFSRLRDPDYRGYVIRRTVVYIFLTLFCIAFLAIMSASTSPLFVDYCDGDSSIFMLIGKAISMGKNVYTDYFDHKGPILFYLNALGFYMTGSKTGVFIIQCIFLSLTAIFMYKTARIFAKTFASVICVIVTILAFASTISDGNLSEEYCMLFCMIPIYLSIKHITKNPDAPHPKRYMFVYGVCFAACAFIRINNGIMIGGIVLVTLVTDFISENIKEAFLNVLMFILGILAAAVPICLFFLIKGTLSDMIFATFTFNFMYASEGSAEKNSGAMSELLLWVLPVLVIIFISTVFSKRLGAKVASLITTISVFALIPILLGFSYTHYYTTLIPLIVIYSAVFFFLAGKRITFWSVILCIVMILPLSGYFKSLPQNISHYAQKAYEQNKALPNKDSRSKIYKSVTALSKHIPDDERNSVFGYDLSSAWFLQADIMPCYRLFTLQESWSSCYPTFGREINQMMIDTPPKWLIVHNIDIIQSRQLRNIINTDYTLIAEYDYDLLFKHND